MGTYLSFLTFIYVFICKCQFSIFKILLILYLANVRNKAKPDIL